MKMRMATAMVVALCAFSGGVADARAAIKPCGALARDALEVSRSFKSCITSTVGCAGVPGRQAFSNNERKLPAAAKNQAYQEGRVGTDHAGFGGVRRLVFLVGGTLPAKQSVVSQYYSDDHYVTFCQID